MLTIPQVIRYPVVMRSRLMLEVASELVAADEWLDKQVMIYFRPQGDQSWRIRFFASDAPNSVDAVAAGEADVAICNPGACWPWRCAAAAPTSSRFRCAPSWSSPS